MWTKYGEDRPVVGQLVEVWSREQERRADLHDREIAVMSEAGRLTLLRADGMIEPTGETMWRHLGWFSKEKFIKLDEPRPEPAPEPIRSIEIKIPSILGLALAGLVWSLKNGVDRVQAQPGDTVL